MSDENPPSHPRLLARLERLQELVGRRTGEEWGRSYVKDVLPQDVATADLRCPRYAGILEESGDACVIVACSLAELAQEMAALAAGEIPMVPIEAVDLDTGKTSLAHCEAVVTFLGAADASPRAGQPGGSAATRARAALVIAVQSGHPDATELSSRAAECLASDLDHAGHYPGVVTLSTEGRAGRCEIAAWRFPVAADRSRGSR